MKTKADLIKWISSKQELVEQVICDSILTYHNTYKDKKNYKYDHERCHKESFRLAGELDLCYDRPTIGLTYASWYLGRRVNTCVDLLLDDIYESVKYKDPIYIFDLGAGTGAVQLATHICLAGMRDLGFDIPKVRIINIDISPFMLDYNLSFIQPSLTLHFGGFSDFLFANSVNSWMSDDLFSISSPWIIASYLFDHIEDQKSIGETFIQLVSKYKPSKLHLCSSSQSHKKEFLNNVSKEIFESYNYDISNISRHKVFTGEMSKVNAIRRDLRVNEAMYFTQRSPSWDEYGFYGQKLEKVEELALDSTEVNKIDLYNPQIIVRSDIIMNRQQLRAAEHNGRPTVISGPAGSGKSVVLTQRVKNIVESENYRSDLKILVTTFNKELTSYLRDWILELLDSEKAYQMGYHISFSNDNSRSPNIYILNFDKIPTRINDIERISIGLNMGFTYASISDQLYLIEGIIKETKPSFKNVRDEYCDPLFLLDEYVRVIYGLQYGKEEQYLNSPRTGRPYNLRYASDQRKFIWQVIVEFLKRLTNTQRFTFYTRRQKLLRALKANDNKVFDHLLVDEFQDCTYADYQIFYGLLKNNNNLVIGGDLAQSVHLGKTSRIPRAEEEFANDERMRNLSSHKLNGSYRLPFRIANCIRPISVHISETHTNAELISAYKGSPPGARPIILYGENYEAVGLKIAWITYWYITYGMFDPSLGRLITILEKDYRLKKYLNDWGISRWNRKVAETDTILRLKGMEKELVVWSTAIKIEDEEDVFHYIYTILTRTSKLLIISLSDDSPEYVTKTFQILKDSNTDYIVWDKETEFFLKKKELLPTAFNGVV